MIFLGREFFGCLPFLNQARPDARIVLFYESIYDYYDSTSFTVEVWTSFPEYLAMQGCEAWLTRSLLPFIFTAWQREPSSQHGQGLSFALLCFALSKRTTLLHVWFKVFGLDTLQRYILPFSASPRQSLPCACSNVIMIAGREFLLPYAVFALSYQLSIGVASSSVSTKFVSFHLRGSFLHLEHSHFNHDENHLDEASPSKT